MQEVLAQRTGHDEFHEVRLRAALLRRSGLFALAPPTRLSTEHFLKAQRQLCGELTRSPLVSLCYLLELVFFYFFFLKQGFGI